MLSRREVLEGLKRIMYKPSITDLKVAVRAYENYVQKLNKGRK